MVIYGASGHSKVIIDIIESNQGPVRFIIDDNPDIKMISGFKVDHVFTDEMKNLPVVIAVGNNRIRKRIADNNPDFEYVSPLVHRKAIINRDVEVGSGSVVMAGAVLNSSVKIGEHCIINTNAVIEHDVQISDYAHISPGAVITGNVKIGLGSHIGASASIIPGVKIGNWVTVGAGAVIIEDIPDNAVVVGNPGKIIKYNN